MNEQINLDEKTELSIWPRVFYMILFAIVFSISETVMFLVAVVNLVFRILKKNNHVGLLKFGGSLANYLQQIARFLTFNTEFLPFPFNEWPSDVDTMKGNNENDKSDSSDGEAHAWAIRVFLT